MTSTHLQDNRKCWLSGLIGTVHLIPTPSLLNSQVSKCVSYLIKSCRVNPCTYSWHVDETKFKTLHSFGRFLLSVALLSISSLSKLINHSEILYVRSTQYAGANFVVNPPVVLKIIIVALGTLGTKRVIYALTCTRCSKRETYVGQTDRPFRDRLAGHRAALLRGEERPLYRHLRKKDQLRWPDSHHPPESQPVDESTGDWTAVDEQTPNKMAQRS